jgi:hypothetical protein
MKSLKKKPIQIYLQPQQDYILGSLAKRKGVSKAEIIRKSLDKFLREIPLEEDPGMGLIGLGKSGKGNISDNHDKYFSRYARQEKR